MTRQQHNALADAIEGERWTVPWSKLELDDMLFSGCRSDPNGVIHPVSWKLSEVVGLLELSEVPKLETAS